MGLKPNLVFVNINFQSQNKSQRLKLGVVANEFFDRKLGRMGGFGWATQQVAKCFNESPDLGVDLVFISGERVALQAKDKSLVHGTKLISTSRNTIHFVRQLWAEKIDILLSIDYRPNYFPIFSALPRTPIIIWVRDPRPPEDMKKIQTVRIPGNSELPQGLTTPDCTSLSRVAKMSKISRRPILFGTPATFLRQKVSGTYGLAPSEVKLLPNIIDLDPGQISKSEKPSVVFLARLDPYKRPWLFLELAHHFPEVDFIFLGQPHFMGKGAWEPQNLPKNIFLKGHVQGAEKIEILSSAWVLINTSIHEGLAVSFQEALRCETPLLSCVNPEEVVSRFGIYVGRYDGDGLAGLPNFINDLKKLLDNHELRTRLGKEGREWVEKTHTKDKFLETFRECCKEAKVL
ncbi:glycosyltransferase family 4 protein [Synechococcus sp. PCC 7335]|uniref:glycosyltransferase family 4 protein n=1 Tax=Synechococcus sp. (strain ATCC 29403 / PCC 7335) TaxID=91464 RepID=UPI001D0D5C63|nr:glycosyltransferase family 4 protein [Synechococcus sp. PCC 7335]